jgi:hypothetical protein
MLRFLKWIFLIFGGLGLTILSFFFIQNKHDLIEAFQHKDKLSYENVKASCLDVQADYYYPCFQKRFEDYLKNVSLTGTSIGLKFAFNFIEEDKKNTSYFIDTAEKDVEYALHYLTLNNLAIVNSTQRFFGLSFTYGGYVGKIKDNLEKAQEFSRGIIEGLEGSEGLARISDQVKKDFYQSRLHETVIQYELAVKTVQSWLDSEVNKLKEKYGE